MSTPLTGRSQGGDPSGAGTRVGGQTASHPQSRRAPQPPQQRLVDEIPSIARDPAPSTRFDGAPHRQGSEPRSRWRASRDSVGAVLGALLGAVPHVLHHVGLIAGAALLTGAAGNVALFVLGLLFSIPLLRRLHRHFRSWMAPALAVAGFAAMFTFSAVVLGPMITGSATAPATPVPSSPVSATPSPSSPAATDHDAHHSG